MPVRLRLQRHGKKGKPFYWIVAADARSVRDGKFLEKIGTYNPNTNPATIDLDVDAAVKWLDNGAQPTDTTRSILSYKGVLYKKHLLGGVKKGAFSQEEVEKRFNDWLLEKESKIAAKTGQLAKAKEEARAKQFEAEKTINDERAKANKEAEEAAIRVEADAKAALEETATEQEEPQAETIEDAVASAAQEDNKTE